MRQLIRPARWLATRPNIFRKDHLRLLSSSVDISYEHGVPSSRASRFNPSTLGQLLEKATLKTPDKPIFIVHHQELVKTYRQFNDDVDQLAKGLREIGCRRGDTVGIWAVNSYEWLLVQFSTAKLGCILVTVNPGYKEKELLNCINLVALKTLICNQQFRTSNYCQVLQNVSPNLLTNAKGCRVQSKEMPSLQNIIVINEREEIAPSNVMRFSELLALGNTEHRLSELMSPQEESQMDDVINVQFTSGTTGSPKGAMLTHFNIVQNVNFLVPRIFEGYQSEDVKSAIIALPNPLYHCFGCVVGSTTTIYLNGTLVLVGPIASATATLQVIDKYRCNFLYGTPTMWSDILLEYKKDADKYNLSSLKRGVMSGAPCPPVLVRKVLHNLTSMENILIPYGSTELSPVVTVTSTQDNEQRQAETVGRPLDYVEVKVVDLSSGQIVPRGSRGEICIRGHCTFPGYFNEPDKTREVVDQNYWYHTGDIGHLDEDGYLTISGRIKEMIIRGGENIYPREIEEYILLHDAVEDVHVIGVPDERLGEELVAFIKIKSGVHSMTSQELKSFLKTKISHFKVPRYIRFVDDFPRTVTGKVRKVELKEMAAKEDFLKN